MSRNELVKGPPFFSPLFKFLPLLPNVPNTTGDTIPFLPLSFIREPESLGSTHGSPSGVADFNAPPAKAIEAFRHGLQVDNRDLIRDLPPQFAGSCGHAVNPTRRNSAPGWSMRRAAASYTGTWA